MMIVQEAPRKVGPRPPAFVGRRRYRLMWATLIVALAGFLFFGAFAVTPFLEGTPTAAAVPIVVPDDMVIVKGGSLRMPADASHPARWVFVQNFWMDRHDVKEEDFARFVASTGHVRSDAKPPAAADAAECDPPKPEFPAAPARTPLPRDDARAYAAWAGKRLPTEAEREWIRQNGLVAKDQTPDGNAFARSLGFRCVKSAR